MLTPRMPLVLDAFPLVRDDSAPLQAHAWLALIVDGLTIMLDPLSRSRQQSSNVTSPLIDK